MRLPQDVVVSDRLPLTLLPPRAVIEKQLTININVLCQLFEYVCASFVYSHRLWRTRSLHDMTLTRRWILSLCNERTLRGRAQDTQLLGLLVQPMRVLLDEVYHGTSGLFLIEDETYINFVHRFPGLREDQKDRQSNSQYLCGTHVSGLCCDHASINLCLRFYLQLPQSISL